jgi:hypothetical protein
MLIPPNEPEQGATIELRQFGMCLIGIGALSFLAGLLYEAVPFAVKAVLGVCMFYVVPISISVCLSDRLRGWTLVASPLILLVAWVAGIFGRYASYWFGLWGLSYSGYGSDDMPGATSLSIALFVALVFAIVGGLLITLLSPLFWTILRSLRHAIRQP